MEWCSVGPDGQGYFWGSHGCTLGDKPHTIHVCQIARHDANGAVIAVDTCCEHDGGNRWRFNGGKWHEYGEGWWQ